ncbi:MAG TPA: YdcF family protein [Vicinamibacterales bacterium]|nr:YdcF family protein [Vicinamibacterales bacterium]
MVPSILKDAFVPGTSTFFLLAASVGTLLLYRKKHNGRAGRLLLTALVLFYWILSTPILAVPLVRILSPEYPPVQTAADARGATAIVVLGAGMETYRSRGATLQAGNREHSLRALEAARVYHVLDKPWVIVSGSLAPERWSEGAQMARSLKLFGVPEDRVVEEGQSRNTHDHTVYIPPILAKRGASRFVLVTSRQHMARALRAFRRAGFDPVPSSPEFYTAKGRWIEAVLPSRSALEASTAMMYDIAAMLYYRVRGWI